LVLKETNISRNIKRKNLADSIKEEEKVEASVAKKYRRMENPSSNAVNIS